MRITICIAILVLTNIFVAFDLFNKMLIIEDLENQVTTFCSGDLPVGQSLPPETIIKPQPQDFIDAYSYKRAADKFKLCGHWATFN